MFIRRKIKPNGMVSVQLVESYRRADKVTQKILRHIGQAKEEEQIQQLEAIAFSIKRSIEEERQPSFPFMNEMEYSFKKRKKSVPDDVKLNTLKEEQRVVEGIGDVFGKLYDELGLNKIIDGTKKNEQWNDILKACVIARLANPSSKRQTASLIERDFGMRVPLEKIYRMMDHVFERESLIKERIAESTRELLKKEVEVLFFDVTTLYFESFIDDELRDFGFSKDCKFKETQVVLSLITTTEGLPISYEVFPGSTSEGTTFLRLVNKLTEKYDVKKAIIVADRAMFTEQNLNTLEEKGINYIVAAKLKGIDKETKNKIIEYSKTQRELLKVKFKDESIKELDSLNNAWTTELEHKSRRLIVSYSPERAKKDLSSRERLVERILKKAKDDKINISDLIPNYGSKKYITVTDKKALLNKEKIELDSLWDGLHGVVTNIRDLEPIEILTKYRGLWQIEAAFRLNKHDLRMRPIYHWTPERIVAHIAICFLAFTVAKQAMYRLNVQQKLKLSFEQIRSVLLSAQASVLVDINTKKRYLLPSKVTVIEKKIYQCFGLKRVDTPSDIN